MTLLLVACGGGGGSPGTTANSTAGSGGSTVGGDTIKLVLQDETGAQSNTVTGSNSLMATAMVSNSAGAPVKNVVVTFALNNSIATLSPSSGTALTDEKGMAKVSVKSSGSGAGAAEITAKTTGTGSNEISVKTAFTVGAAPSAKPTAINFVAALPSDKSIVIKGAGGNGRTEVALLTFNVVDSTNSGVSNAAVDFTVQSTHPVTLVSSTGVTDSNGAVTVALNSGTTPTTVRVIATVHGTSISAISDQVTVTTGQPEQTAFSIALEKFYVEGLNYDNTQNKVTVLLADKFGGAVADGTQVVFTTDSGAIVGDGGARCLTINGECTVIWRSQNPRNTKGIGTIIATATNETSNLSASTQFYYSGSFAKVYKVTLDAEGNVANRQSSGGPIVLDFTSSCNSQVIDIEVADVNDNPMPEITQLTAQNASNAALSIAPNRVSFTGMRLNREYRGTVHSVTVTPSGCKSSGAATKTGSALISVKTPFGGETVTTVNLGSFPSE